ncbi:MAG: helix-turn-helix transcriptional regulator [Legionella sp.]|uniref:helix-turn-helix domain-containing protein n=1 Tax=Legionella sp. TaxID=459 RepID=UPI0039E584D8
MTECLINSVGDRITYCRSSLHLTRKELIDEWAGASVPTLVRWELGTVKIPAKKIPSLVDYFNLKGLIVTVSWISQGVGAPPILMSEKIFEEIDFDSLAQENLLELNRKTKNFIFGQVKNNLLSPYIRYGDYVGGSKILIKVLNTFCGDLIFLKNPSGFNIGILEECAEQLILRNFERSVQNSFNTDSIELAGKIQWIAKRP